MKSGIELIAVERQEQIEKHGRTAETDELFNAGYQLCKGASSLLFSPTDEGLDLMSADLFRPKGWNKDIWDKMLGKPYKERLIIAGALIAAEIDRLQVTNP